jgi:cell wall-associated NlpC family hydrolase
MWRMRETSPGAARHPRTGLARPRQSLSDAPRNSQDDPGIASPVLAVQRTAGNRAATQLLAAHQTTVPLRVQRSPLQDLLDAASVTAKLVSSGASWIGDAVTQGPILATVMLKIRNGNHDADSLTNTAFWMLHPELGGRKLDPEGTPGDDVLAREWVKIRKEVVQPALRDYERSLGARTEPGTETGGGTTTGPVPSLGTDVGTNAETFFEEHRTELAELPGSDDELKLLLTLIIDKGATDADYPNWLKPTGRWVKPGPLTQAVFRHRNAEKQPLTNIPIWKYGKLEDQWAANGLTQSDWKALNDIKEELVYPLLRYTLPRITETPALAAGAGTGAQIAAAAYSYLGVKYEVGGTWSRKEQTGNLDCSGLVSQVFQDVGVKVNRGSSGNGVTRLHDSDLAVVTEPQAGDLLLRQKDGKWKHVGIYVGDGKLIDAPATGTVVRVSSYDSGKWDEIRRYVE